MPVLGALFWLLAVVMLELAFCRSGFWLKRAVERMDVLFLLVPFGPVVVEGPRSLWLLLLLLLFDPVARIWVSMLFGVIEVP